MSSPNKSVIDSLIQPLQSKDTKLYDLLNRMSSDVDKSYSALFSGPLPSVSAKNLDFSGSNFTKVPETSFPATSVFTDLANVFLQDQTIQKTDPTLFLNGTYPQVKLGVDTATKFTHLKAIEDGGTLLGSGMDWDGVNFTADAGNPVGLILNHSSLPLEVKLFVAAVLKSALQILSTGAVVFGNSAFTTGVALNELLLLNQKWIRGNNVAVTKVLPMIGIDPGDLVQLGSNPTGATTGEGNIGIPIAIAADLPVAAANRDGILILDKTNNRLAYYVSGNRYRIALGTAF